MMRSHCIFVIGVIFTSFTTAILCAPTKDSQEMIGPDVKEFYDQRQNGTENFRIDIKDFAIVITPLETLLNIATMLDPIFLEGFTRSDLQKESPHVSNITESDMSTEQSSAEEENNISLETKAKRGLKSRIGNLILPFVRRHH